MTHKVKVLGIAFIAVLAMNAIAASAAHATKFTSAAYPAIITGTQFGPENEFETEIGNVECGTGTFTGELKGASETLSLTPTYGSCFVGGLVPASVDMNGCSYLFHTTGSDTVNADVVCPANVHISVTIPASNCDVTIKPQTVTGFTLTQTSTDVEVHVDAETVAYEFDPTKEGGCSGKTGTRTNGAYFSTVTIQGDNGKVSFD